MKNISSALKTALIQPIQVIRPTAWLEHIPFASWILVKQQPAIFVELGTLTGTSYSAFCQSVREHGLKRYSTNYANTIIKISNHALGS